MGERDARLAFRDKVADGKLMSRVVHDVKELLLGEGAEPTELDANELWDEEVGSVPGGVNWATDYADNVTDESFLGVTGPDLDPAKQVDW